MKAPKTTESMMRVFTCKMCGKEVSESINRWKRKPTKYKRVCQDCIPKNGIPQSRNPYKTYFPKPWGWN